MKVAIALSKSTESLSNLWRDVMDDKWYKRERARQARLERLCSNKPKCMFCTEDDPCCLELHHLGGSEFSDDRVVVCRNHHRKLSDKQHEHPAISAGTPSTLECRGRLLLGIADALELSEGSRQLVDLTRQTGLRLIEDGRLSQDRGREQA
jgi:hypothetical protein